jgi:hypothetical protein
MKFDFLHCKQFTPRLNGLNPYNPVNRRPPTGYDSIPSLQIIDPPSRVVLRINVFESHSSSPILARPGARGGIQPEFQPLRMHVVSEGLHPRNSFPFARRESFDIRSDVHGVRVGGIAGRRSWEVVHPAVVDVEIPGGDFRGFFFSMKSRQKFPLLSLICVKLDPYLRMSTPGQCYLIFLTLYHYKFFAASFSPEFMR